MDQYAEYFAFLDKLGGVLDKLSVIAREKAAAVRRDDLLAVEDCMKREQALSLQLRSMDKERDRRLAALGLTGVPLSGMADRCPADKQIQARAAQEKLMGKYNVYRSASEAARSALECNLHEFDKFIAEDTAKGLNGGLTDFRA